MDRSVDAAPSEKVNPYDSQTSVDNIKTKKFPVPDKEQGISLPVDDGAIKIRPVATNGVVQDFFLRGLRMAQPSSLKSGSSPFRSRE